MATGSSKEGGWTASPVLSILFASVGYLCLQFILTPIRIRILTTILTKEQYGTLTLVIMTISCISTVISLGSFEYLLRKIRGTTVNSSTACCD